MIHRVKDLKCQSVIVLTDIYDGEETFKKIKGWISFGSRTLLRVMGMRSSSPKERV